MHRRDLDLRRGPPDSRGGARDDRRRVVEARDTWTHRDEPGLLRAASPVGRREEFVNFPRAEYAGLSAAEQLRAMADQLEGMSRKPPAPQGRHQRDDRLFDRRLLPEADLFDSALGSLRRLPSDLAERSIGVDRRLAAPTPRDWQRQGPDWPYDAPVRTPALEDVRDVLRRDVPGHILTNGALYDAPAAKRPRGVDWDPRDGEPLRVSQRARFDTDPDVRDMVAHRMGVRDLPQPPDWRAENGNDKRYWPPPDALRPPRDDLPPPQPRRDHLRDGIARSPFHRGVDLAPPPPYRRGEPAWDDPDAADDARRYRRERPRDFDAGGDDDAFVKQVLRDVRLPRQVSGNSSQSTFRDGYQEQVGGARGRSHADGAWQARGPPEARHAADLPHPRGPEPPHRIARSPLPPASGHLDQDRGRPRRGRRDEGPPPGDRYAPRSDRRPELGRLPPGELRPASADQRPLRKSGAGDGGSLPGEAADDDPEVKRLRRVGRPVVLRLRWLIKQRLAQIDMLMWKIVHMRGTRTRRMFELYRLPVAGISLSTLIDDYGRAFKESLVPAALGYPKLKALVEAECNDFLACAMLPEVHGHQLFCEVPKSPTRKCSRAEIDAVATHEVGGVRVVPRLGSDQPASRVVFSMALRELGFAASDVQRLLEDAGADSAIGAKLDSIVAHSYSKGSPTKQAADRPLSPPARKAAPSDPAPAPTAAEAGKTLSNDLLASDRNVIGMESDDEDVRQAPRDAAERRPVARSSRQGAGEQLAEDGSEALPPAESRTAELAAAKKNGRQTEGASEPGQDNKDKGRVPAAAEPRPERDQTSDKFTAADKAVGDASAGDGRSAANAPSHAGVQDIGGPAASEAVGGMEAGVDAHQGDVVHNDSRAGPAAGGADPVDASATQQE